jgi:hypothetical protein
MLRLRLLPPLRLLFALLFRLLLLLFLLLLLLLLLQPQLSGVSKLEFKLRRTCP